MVRSGWFLTIGSANDEDTYTVFLATAFLRYAHISIVEFE